MRVTRDATPADGGQVQDPAEDLCRHLNELKVQARVVDRSGPEAIEHRIPLMKRDVVRCPRLAVIRVEGRNTELVELVKARSPRGSPQGHHVVFTLRVVVPAAWDPYLADITNPMEGGHRRYPMGSAGNHWTGAELAERLNGDARLVSMMSQMGWPELQVRGIADDGCVCIAPRAGEVEITEERPSAQFFEAIERIAAHIRGVEALLPQLEADCAEGRE